MQKPFMRIPFTGPLPPPIIIPRFANTATGSVHALCNFLVAPKKDISVLTSQSEPRKTVLLTGAGLSVASGLADYRGAAGTYTLNRSYRPIYYNEYISNHEARKRYWARSFFGWTNLHRARPNPAYEAIKFLADMGLINSVITQSTQRPTSHILVFFMDRAAADDMHHLDVDSFHLTAHPELPTIELHGYLRSLVCINCQNYLPRIEFQKSLSNLNPLWTAFLAEMLEAGALDTENPQERSKRGLKTNPDGDVDLPNAPYSSFRYPPCPTCLERPPLLPDGTKSIVETDADGAWSSVSTAGILKPAVTMFGESISAKVKKAAEEAVDTAGRILVIGSSLATYSAWRLVKRATEQGLPLGILNLGGVRGEEAFFAGISADNDGALGFRCNERAEILLPQVVESLRDININRPFMVSNLFPPS